VSVKVIAELNPVSLERTTREAAPQSVSEIIKSLDTGFGEDHARVSLNGEILKDFSVIAKDGDTLWIKFVFYGSGSTEDAGWGMKGGGLAAILLGIGLSFIPVVGQILGSAMIGAGLGMIASGVVLYNTEIPALKDREKPQTDPSVRGSRNQARQHGRIPVLFGRHRLYPDLAANSYTEIRDGAQYLVQLFCGGYRDCEIDPESFKLGETPLT
jgi:hypothetical protein